jgi:alkanesulfonate monooxygenase SsuD/methylene tetrahydromethanopterin reductase-like flavin-dependent oxidoreductase (luciferase family)
MRVGMSLTSSYPRQGSSKSLLDNLSAQVQLMAELGFASLSLGDHHITREYYFQVLPTISRLSAYTGDMQLLPLFLLPFYHPILLAEQVATLDVMSGGRVTMICCLGHQPEAHDAFQTPQRVRVSRFVESFEIIRRLCAEEDVTYQGKHYAFTGVSINPKPLQQPLPMWIGASADPAIRRTAQLANAWVISPGWTPGLVEEKLQVYRSALQEYGRSHQVSDVILRRDLHLAATTEAARHDAQRLFDRGYRGFGRQELQESLIVGGPQDCIRYLEHMQRLGITHVLFRCALNEPDKALQTIRLLGTEVIPHFHASSARG